MSSREFSQINVHLQPSARVEQICGWIEGDFLKIKVREKPLEGKANQALKKLLAKALDIRITDIEITSGEKSRRKTVKIFGKNQSEM